MEIPKNYSYIAFFIIIAIIAFVIIYFVNRKKKLSNNDYYKISINIDKIYNNIKKNKCEFYDDTIIENIKEINLIQKLSKCNKILLINPKDCFTYNINDTLQKCKNIKINDVPNCDMCKKMWNETTKNIAFILPSNLRKTYINRNDLFIYKRYFCNKNKYLIIGIVITNLF